MRSQRVHLNIPVAGFGPILSWDEDTIDDLVDAAYDAAQRVGLRISDDDGVYLKEAESKGGTIDWDNRAVMFTVRQIDAAVTRLRESQPVPEPVRPPARCDAGRDARFFVGNGANMLFDWDNWQAKVPVASDLIDLCRWAQGTDGVGSLFCPVMLGDVDPRLEPLYNLAITCKYCRKRIQPEQPSMPTHLKYMPY